jgi:hypothetical protein
MILDGELLSNALVLRRHNKRIDGRRCYNQRPQISVDGKQVPWHKLSAEQQLEHISGYAAGVAGEDLAPDASPVFVSGYHEGRSTELAARLIDSGATSTAEVLEPSGRRTVATGLKPMDEMHGYYTGFLAPSPLRPYEQKAMIARDAIVGVNIEASVSA